MKPDNAFDACVPRMLTFRAWEAEADDGRVAEGRPPIRRYGYTFVTDFIHRLVISLICSD